jgi:hypothetical protein
MVTKIDAKGIKLTEKEMWELEKLSSEYDAKIARNLKQDSEDVLINIHMKAHEKEGKRQKYHAHVEVKATTDFGALGEDWDIAAAMHKAMNKILSEIEHRFHVSDQNKRNWNKKAD